MDDKYKQLIEILANKLGTTAEHLWAILLKQAPISSAVDLVLCIVLPILILRWISLLKRKTTIPIPTEYDRFPNAEWNGTIVHLLIILTFVVCLFTSLYIIVSIPEIVSGFINPEYWALMRLVNH